MVKLPGWLVEELEAQRQSLDLPIFRSRKGGSKGKLSSTSVTQIVKISSQNSAVSAHWLRHAHASHSIDGGAPISLVQSTLGHSSVATTSKYLHAKPNDSSGLYL